MHCGDSPRGIPLIFWEFMNEDGVHRLYIFLLLCFLCTEDVALHSMNIKIQNLPNGIELKVVKASYDVFMELP